MVRLALDPSPSELHFPPSDAGRAAPPPSRHEGAFHPMSLGPPVHQFSWGSTLEKPPPTLPSTISSGSTSFQSGIPLRVRVQTELDDARLEAAEAARRRARLLTASLSEPALLPSRRESWRGGAREAQLAFDVLHGHSHMTFTPPRRASLSPPRQRSSAALHPMPSLAFSNHAVPGPRTVLDQYGGVLSPPKWSKAPTTARARHRHPVQQAIGVRLPPLRDPLLDPLRAAAGAGAATVTAAAAARPPAVGIHARPGEEKVRRAKAKSRGCLAVY